MAKKITIAISGMPGAGSSTVAKLLARRLKLTHFSAGDYVKALGSKGIPETERALKIWKGSLQTPEFNKDLDEAVAAKGKEGNVVIDGKLAVHFLKDIAEYKIWLKCPMKIRAERVAKRDGIAYEKAITITQEKEKAERENWKKIYGFDYFEQEADADISIDTSKHTPEEIVDKIESALAARKHDHRRKFL